MYFGRPDDLVPINPSTVMQVFSGSYSTPTTFVNFNDCFARFVPASNVPQPIHLPVSRHTHGPVISS